LSEPAFLPDGWSLQEIALFDQGKTLFPSAEWQLEAPVNPWEAGLAFDRNPVSRWRTWREAERDVFLAVHFSQPLEVDMARVLVFEPPRGLVATLEGLASGGTAWKTLAEPSWRPAPALNYRRQAISMVKREGFGYILTRSGEEGLSRIGKDLVESAGSWGLRKVEEVDGVYLLALE
jgi:hypothetical protein